MLGAVARARHGHLHKGGDAAGDLDEGGEPRDRADEERVALEGWHIEPARTRVGILDDNRASEKIHPVVHEKNGVRNMGRMGDRAM